MNSSIYTDKFNGLLITSRFEDWEKKIKLGIFPDFEYAQTDILNLKNNIQIIDSVAFDKVSSDDFNLVNSILKQKRIGAIAIHESDISNSPKLFCQHLIIGEKVTIDLKNEMLNAVEGITFLSLKTYKGKVIDDLTNIKNLTVWHDKGYANSLFKKTPALESLQLYDTSVEALDLSLNPYLNSAGFYVSKNLQKVYFSKEKLPENIGYEACPNLDLERLPPRRDLTKERNLHPDILKLKATFELFLEKNLNYSIMSKMTFEEYKSFVFVVFDRLNELRNLDIIREDITPFIQAFYYNESFNIDDSDILFERRFSAIVEEIEEFCPNPHFWETDYKVYLKKWDRWFHQDWLKKI